MKEHTISVVKHAAGFSVYLNDRRIAGPKPWGGGTEIFAAKIDADEVKTVIDEVSK